MQYNVMKDENKRLKEQINDKDKQLCQTSGNSRDLAKKYGGTGKRNKQMNSQSKGFIDSNSVLKQKNIKIWNLQRQLKGKKLLKYLMVSIEYDITVKNLQEDVNIYERKFNSAKKEVEQLKKIINKIAKNPQTKGKFEIYNICKMKIKLKWVWMISKTVKGRWYYQIR